MDGYRCVAILATLLGIAAGTLNQAQDGVQVIGPRESTRTDLFGDPLPPGAIVRFGTVRFRHHARIHCLALSPDGKTVATAGGQSSRGIGQVIRLWDRATGREVGQLLGLEDSPGVIAFSPDGKKLASVVGMALHEWGHTVRI
jgi:WD40 repeat protein